MFKVRKSIETCLQTSALASLGYTSLESGPKFTGKETLGRNGFNVQRLGGGHL